MRFVQITQGAFMPYINVDAVAYFYAEGYGTRVVFSADSSICIDITPEEFIQVLFP